MQFAQFASHVRQQALHVMTGACPPKKLEQAHVIFVRNMHRLKLNV